MFLLPIEAIFERMPVFALVLFRVSGLAMFDPLLGLSSVPPMIRALFLFVVSLALWPLVPGLVYEPVGWVDMAIAVAAEMSIGITMGLILTFVTTGIKIGAELISQQMGLSMSDMVDPVSGESSTLLQEYYNLLLTAFYVLINGHLILIRTLADTFKQIPLASPLSTEPILTTLVNVLTVAFQAGIRLAGPALVAVFLATLALGLISRTMPQLNILAAGFPIRIVLTMFVMITSLGAGFYIFNEYIVFAFNEIGGLFQ
ncbi:MAG: flagellar biosynthetic protein FliR [Sedimentisphaerales bacterium]|nr:flagellar biosynthetic protein FliR [Sedimentisphaerales bacterium]